jgi:hypothetical protein
MLVGREAAEGLQPQSMVVGVDERLQVRPALVVGLVLTVASVMVRFIRST